MRMMISIAATAMLGGVALAQNVTTPISPAATTAPAAPSAATTPLARPGFSANRGAMMQACQADFQKLCAGMTPGDGKLGPCIRENRAKLSPSCQGALQARLGAGGRAGMPPMPPMPIQPK